MAMDNSTPSTTSLFDVYLRLRPPTTAQPSSRFLDVDDPPSQNRTSDGDSGQIQHKTHVTLVPLAQDNRKRAVEKFAFTRVFEEDDSQLDVFNGAAVVPLIEGVLGAEGKLGRDGLVATLGVTGSGKSHTILGSKTQRGLTQLTLDVLFSSIGSNVSRSFPTELQDQLSAADVSEAQILPASQFLQSIYGDASGDSRMTSRAQTPMTECNWAPIYPASTSKRPIPRASNLPQIPSIANLPLPATSETAEYAVVVSMYEVYNDRIFDLLTGAALASKTPLKDLRRRPLLFKSTERSTERKVVAGLKKIVCETLEEALLVLETGLTERRVAGTGTNATSSRSHGFFCVEVKKKARRRGSVWTSSTLTIVDLAGSERARTAKTAGATLAEAGKINESLMYLGQCMQMQADNSINSGTTAADKLVPFRQCKLTELLFSNSFAYHNNQHRERDHSTSTVHHTRQHTQQQQQPQKSIMIVTADPRGDFNATSQILRYSALAREVTVPRIPSVTSTILAGCPTPTPGSSRPNTANGNEENSMGIFTRDAEIARLQEELFVMRMQLEEERQRRREAEASWAIAEGRLEDMEAEIREECWNEFENRLVTERQRWSAAWDEERERVEGHLDRKVDLLVRGMDDVHIDDGALGETWKGKMEVLEHENEVLKERVAGFERQREAVRTPSRKMKVLKARKWNLDDDELDQENICP